jgi:hypothetical protein
MESRPSTCRLATTLHHKAVISKGAVRSEDVPTSLLKLSRRLFYANLTSLAPVLSQPLVRCLPYTHEAHPPYNQPTH